MQHIWTIFVKNTYTCERIAIEIDIKDAAILVLFQNFKAHHILIFLVNFIWYLHKVHWNTHFNIRTVYMYDNLWLIKSRQVNS